MNIFANNFFSIVRIAQKLSETAFSGPFYPQHSSKLQKNGKKKFDFLKFFLRHFLRFSAILFF